MKYPSYPSYKPSGIEWLGDVPEHWQVKRLKWTASYRVSNVDKVPAENEEPVRLCNYTDVYYKDFIVAASGVTRYGLPKAAIGTAWIPLPSTPEQEVITAFLDTQTAKIDTLVEKKRVLIEKLKEKRIALISAAVTGKVAILDARHSGENRNPDKPGCRIESGMTAYSFKPTGIDWLGDVPEHWEVKQLKWAIMFQRGHDLPADEREDGKIPLVTSSGVSATHTRAVAKSPGIVTGRYGTIGEFHLLSEDYWPLNTTLYSIDLCGNEARFLKYMLIHMSPLFLLNSVKSAVPGVDRNDIHPIKAAVPPVVDQRVIADFLDCETAKIDSMVKKVEAAIERLREYRTALITAAVTGKIDVRSVA